MHNKHQYKYQQPQNGAFGETNMQNQNIDNGQQNGNMQNGQTMQQNATENVATLNQNPYVNPQPQMQQPQFSNNQNPYMNTQMQQPQMQMNMQQNPYMNMQPQYQNIQNQSSNITSKISQTANHIFDNKFLLGVVVGGVATYLLTNDDAQKALIKTGMKLFSKVAGGVEEIKEKMMDAQAELEQEKEDEKSL